MQEWEGVFELDCVVFTYIFQAYLKNRGAELEMGDSYIPSLEGVLDMPQACVVIFIICILLALCSIASEVAVSFWESSFHTCSATVRQGEARTRTHLAHIALTFVNKGRGPM